MSMLHQLPTQPDIAVMHQVVQTLFRHAGLKGLVELGWTSQHHPHKFTGARLFDLGEIDDLVEYAAQINVTPNRNVYVSAGLRNEATARDRRASDSDVCAIAACKADFDQAGALAAALDIAAKLKLPPNLVTFTGAEPHLRGQLWWLLEEPCEDTYLVRSLDGALAARLGGDPSVLNASRLMRLAGSVAWPLKQGRVLEMTGVLADAETRNAPYSVDEIKSALTRAGALEITRPSAKILDFSTAEPTLDLESLIDRAGEPGQWHRHALLAVAHLTARGTPPDVCLDVLAPRLTQPGYVLSQTYEELRVMTAGAFKRGMAPEKAPSAAPEQNPASKLPLLSIDAMAATEPPTWRVEGFLPDSGFGVLYGPSGVYKSFVALDLALSVAHGLPWRGRSTTQAPVVYIAGEGTYGIPKRVLVWKQHRAAEITSDDKFWLAPVALNLLDKTTVAFVIERLQSLPEIPRVVVVDTLARAFGPGNENDAKDMNAFVAACDSIARGLNAFVLTIHHAGKDTEKGARGSSVLRAAADVEIRVSKGVSDRSAIVRVTKQKEAEEPSPLSVRMVSAEGSHPITGEVIQSLIPIADEDVNPSGGRSLRIGKRERDVLAILEDGPQRHGTIAARLGLKSDRKAVSRALQGLITKGLATEEEGFYSVSDYVADRGVKGAFGTGEGAFRDQKRSPDAAFGDDEPSDEGGSYAVD